MQTAEFELGGYFEWCDDLIDQSDCLSLISTHPMVFTIKKPAYIFERSSGFSGVNPHHSVGVFIKDVGLSAQAISVFCCG